MEESFILNNTDSLVSKRWLLISLLMSSSCFDPHSFLNTLPQSGRV